MVDETSPLRKPSVGHFIGSIAMLGGFWALTYDLVKDGINPYAGTTVVQRHKKQETLQQQMRETKWKLEGLSRTTQYMERDLASKLVDIPTNVSSLVKKMEYNDEHVTNLIKTLDKNITTIDKILEVQKKDPDMKGYNNCSWFIIGGFGLGFLGLTSFLAFCYRQEKRQYDSQEGLG